MPSKGYQIEEESQFYGEVEDFHQCPTLFREQPNQGIDADGDGELGAETNAQEC